jgi:hypothetical protein
MGALGNAALVSRPERPGFCAYFSRRNPAVAKTLGQPVQFREHGMLSFSPRCDAADGMPIFQFGDRFAR